MKQLQTLVLMVCVLLFTDFAAAGQQKMCPQPTCPTALKAEKSRQRVDSFLVIFDSSESMDEMYNGQKKIEMAKRIACCMNARIPDFKMTAGLRTFGRGYGLFSINSTDLIYGMTDYTKPGMKEGLGKITFAAGNTPLSLAIDAATADLQSVEGDIAVIIISDGMSNAGDPIEAAENMKKTYGDRICIYTILVGDDFEGYKTMRDIANAGECGFMVKTPQITTPEGLTDFVRKVFLGYRVEAQPAPEPEPYKVVEKVVLNAVMFDLDKSDIKPTFYPVLDEAIEILQKHASKNVLIEGHTCSLGSDAYNQGLSERRATSVKKYLIDKGIKPQRLRINGRGETKPVADNATEDGRKRNRRVEFLVIE